jgi:uncharacterized membrane protein YdjX (TVP38/TMEM64 family)
MRRVLPLALLALLVGLVVAGGTVRTRIGVDLSPESVRAYVLGLGLTAQVVFVGLVIFRNFLLLPSMVVLTAGGLAFGVTLGTLLGGAGILLSGMMKFGVARAVGREWIRPRLGETFRRFEHRLERTGPLLIGLATAHPMGPMSPFHWAAGLSSIPWLPFLAAIGTAGCLRAFAYAYFGSTLLEAGSAEFFGATAFLAAIALLPLAHRGVRGRLFGGGAQ